MLLRSQQVSAKLGKLTYRTKTGQLVGTALLILVKSGLTAVIRNVEAASHKV